MGSAGRGGHAPTSSPHSSPTYMPPTLVCTQGVLVTNSYPYVHAQPALLLRSTGVTAARRTTTSRSGTRAAVLINFETHHHPHIIPPSCRASRADARRAMQRGRERRVARAGARSRRGTRGRERAREREARGRGGDREERGAWARGRGAERHQMSSGVMAPHATHVLWACLWPAMCGSQHPCLAPVGA